MHSNPRATALMSGLLLAGVAPAALAGLDTFTLKRSSGPCGDFKLPTGHLLWSNLTRIRVATDATGAGIYEWFDGRGRTTNYPNAPIVMGTKFPKGYVAIAIRSDSEHGTGNRTVTVKWSTGNETIPLKVEATCEDLRDAPTARPRRRHRNSRPARRMRLILRSHTARRIQFRATPIHAVEPGCR